MAPPTFQALLDADASTGNVSLTWSAASVNENDIILIGMETNAGEHPQNPDGYLHLGPTIDADDTALTVFWRRCNGDEAGVDVLGPGDHVVVNATLWRGCVTEGEPWDILVTGVDNTSNTTLSATGGTTTVADTLVVVFSTLGTDTDTSQFSGWTNADLGSVTERADNFSSQGSGGGIGIASGTKTAAGTFGAMTATLANAAKKTFSTFALKPTDSAPPAAPFVTKQLDQFGGTGSATPAWSVKDVLPNDIILLLCESSDEAVSTPSGYTAVDDSPQSASGTTRLTAFWKRSDGTETGVTVADPGDHILVTAFAIRGCPLTGDPWNATSGGSETSSDTSVSVPGATTTTDDCLVLVASSNSVDVSAQGLSSGWANGDLTDVHLINDTNTADGNGGGISVVTGRQASAGTYGATTGTLSTASTKAYMTIAFPPTTLHVTTFTVGGATTWTKPASAERVLVICVGGGGGGGGGRTVASGAAGSGGGGGGGAAVTITELSADDCSGTETITVGAAGTGQAANTAGGNGGLSSFGTTVKAKAGGGGGGAAGAAAAQIAGGGGGSVDANGSGTTGGAPASLPSSTNVAGGSSAVCTGTGGVGNASEYGGAGGGGSIGSPASFGRGGGHSIYGGPGGGGGGGKTTGDVGQAGGAGGDNQAWGNGTDGGGGAGGNPATAGPNGSTTKLIYCGSAGDGGGGGSNVAGANGGTGGPGAGGGGGGAGSTGGTGGNGGAGYVLVVTWTDDHDIADAQIFEAGAAQTWTMPTSASIIQAVVVGSGGGGGAGAGNNASAALGGGGGGGGGSVGVGWILASELGATETVNVGAGGSPASDGNQSDFGTNLYGYGGIAGGAGSGVNNASAGGHGASVAGSTVHIADSAIGGQGGNTSQAADLASSSEYGGAGGGTKSAGGGTEPGGDSIYGGPGGGKGGGRAGGVGGAGSGGGATQEYSHNSTGSESGGAGGAAGANDGGDGTFTGPWCGDAGGGGGASTGAGAGNGGDGSIAAGGGGGGAGDSTHAGGTGGSGGDGRVYVFSW